MRVENCKKRKLVPFTCKRCGETLMLPYAKNRLFCPECSKIVTTERKREWNKEAYWEKKRQAATVVVEEPKVTDYESVDAKINAQIRMQCKRCRYWSVRNNTDVSSYCSYYLRYGVGHRVDPGNGPGDCRCFEPRRKITKKERVQQSLDALIKSEVDAAVRKRSAE